MPSDLASLARRCLAHGLRLRGGFHPEAGDGVTALPDGRVPATLILVGNVGSSLWASFSGSPEAQDGAPHPLNRWTQRVVSQIAAEAGAAALFPFGGPPYLPFQRWAMRAEPVAASPLGILIHPDYGLWHAYRGALAFADRLALPPRVERPRPCDSCADRPCLSACPVGAFTARGYDVPACIGHIAGPAGAACLDGCLARRACPVGADFAYDAAQGHFHMAAFLAANRAR
ncbi:MAG: ferredoxin [Dongiaceae bacterium]